MTTGRLTKLFALGRIVSVEYVFKTDQIVSFLRADIERQLEGGDEVADLVTAYFLVASVAP